MLRSADDDVELSADIALLQQGAQPILVLRRYVDRMDRDIGGSAGQEEGTPTVEPADLHYTQLRASSYDEEVFAFPRIEPDKFRWKLGCRPR